MCVLSENLLCKNILPKIETIFYWQDGTAGGFGWMVPDNNSTVW